MQTLFGSLFGHSVTQNLPVLAVQELRSPANFEKVFTLALGPSLPVFPEPGERSAAAAAHARITATASAGSRLMDFIVVPSFERCGWLRSSPAG